VMISRLMPRLTSVQGMKVSICTPADCPRGWPDAAVIPAKGKDFIRFSLILHKKQKFSFVALQQNITPAGHIGQEVIELKHFYSTIRNLNH
jgi:hypothetical protein